ncbi:hypothetical protein CYMTET_42176 [Cymbomonas tetramitiformis]|uniref:DNA-directed RNA polymerase subunit n=1 Tax=Cymbomonas tetramitiformis TaxID=36881 RepID=A0AAE0C5Q5_9CHLO|nr:hypothetical protein CYMTET_42176 [Cymbomonas tetramitiformis]
MQAFCPTCANLLMVEFFDLTGLRYACQTCPYVYNVDRKLAKKHSLHSDQKVEDVIGPPEEWELADKTEACCPKCEHGYAFVVNLQISAEGEPPTSFYKCANGKCSHRWREG